MYSLWLLHSRLHAIGSDRFEPEARVFGRSLTRFAPPRNGVTESDGCLNPQYTTWKTNYKWRTSKTVVLARAKLTLCPNSVHADRVSVQRNPNAAKRVSLHSTML